MSLSCLHSWRTFSWDIELSWQFFPFVELTTIWVDSSFLPGLHGYWENSAVNQIAVFLRERCHFLWLLLRFLLCLLFSVWLWWVLFGFILFDVLWGSCICKFVLHWICEIFCNYFFKKFVSIPVFSFSPHTPITCPLDHFRLSHKSWGSVHFFATCFLSVF